MLQHLSSMRQVLCSWSELTQAQRCERRVAASCQNAREVGLSKPPGPCKALDRCSCTCATACSMRSSGSYGSPSCRSGTSCCLGWESIGRGSRIEAYGMTSTETRVTCNINTSCRCVRLGSSPSRPSISFWHAWIRHLKAV